MCRPPANPEPRTPNPPLSFFLLLLVTATLFVRPAEIVADLEALPIYNYLILACLILSLPNVMPLLTGDALKRQPITLGVLGMLAAVFLSHASHGDLWSARFGALEFSKTVILYLLLVANVNSVNRLQVFLAWLLACITLVALLAVLQYHGVIHIASLEVLVERLTNPLTGFIEDVVRMRSTGLFNDPNDLAMILVVGMALAAYFFSHPRAVQLKLPLLALAVMFFYALLLTKSRGGLLALMAALGTQFQARYGWKKSLMLGALALPLVLVLVKGRQSDIGGAIGEGTGQSRIQLWSGSLGLFRRAPLFGIGYNLCAEEIGQVSHNSYVHAFAELGMFGGAMFLGMIFYALRSLYRLGLPPWMLPDANLARLRPFLLSAVAGYSASMLTLSRGDVAPTYVILGLPAVYFNQVRAAGRAELGAFDSRLVKNVAKVSVAYLACLYVFVRVFARWSG